ncbi:hypothetical protein SAMN02745883_01766 [Caminicella sporogenes DSM 14501]|uniref:Uncharacterized protein n=1 Tax=Caminicella sporogenes DSM 14501 TaxID=1121266 RepID=A0A1M6REP5_9FIRM|nr:hypothetical protein [Caminicella sporogenes]RKD25214.1 hypothetical protein BET04_03060 [Caminicella sporogenes]SHK30929.1 hypothetical protein SAMN02745883_01766 [Caminicella sporogenes DSM 14501]
MIASLVCFLSAYGKKIEIITNQNFKANILIDNKNEDVDSFLQLISPNKMQLKVIFLSIR